MSIVNDPVYQSKVHDIVRQIPPGHVMTYGQIAGLLGDGYTARTVGYVMHNAPNDVPWQRVVNSQGKCSTGRLTIPINLQQELLQTEGIKFNAAGKCNMHQYQYIPQGSAEDDDEQTTLFG